MSELTDKELKWLKKLQKTLDTCPQSLRDRASSYTIGDPVITIFDEYKYIDTGKDVCIDVRASDCAMFSLSMPFDVWSTAG